MQEYINGILIGITFSICIFIFSGATVNKRTTNEILQKIQLDISNIESDVYRMSEKGVECNGSVRCGGGFVDQIIEKVDCK